MNPLIDEGDGRGSVLETPAVEPVETLTTARLRLHTWNEADAQALYRLSTDPEVMRFFPSTPTRAQVFELVRRQRENLAAGLPGLFAVSVVSTSSTTVSEHRLVEPVETTVGSPTGCIGFVGLATPTFEAPFMPTVEIGWRLAKQAWGRGYATEAGRAALEHGFRTLGLPEIVSFTAVPNAPSIAVMRRLGMHRDPKDDFDHPRVPEGHPLRRHVLYRLRAEEWQPD
jgi:RimJ/RimL family protein N-acetyltransferase